MAWAFPGREPERAEQQDALQPAVMLLATVSHELRAPLTAMLAWIRVAKQSDEPARIARAIEVIERQAQAQQRLIEDLLDFVRMQSGQLRMQRDPCELSHTVEAVLEVLRPRADKRGQTLSADLSPGCTVQADAQRIEQVLTNLIGNALKFSPDGARVEVTLSRQEDGVELRVRDEGRGISPDFLPHVFDSFTQADETHRREHGLGLGLAISKHIVAMHGGTLQAHSRGLGHGSTFVVRLPLSAS